VSQAGKLPSRLARLPLDAPLRATRVAAVVQAALLLTLCLLPGAAQVSTLTHSTAQVVEHSSDYLVVLNDVHAAISMHPVSIVVKLKECSRFEQRSNS
jgi:hypothetical protein